MWEVGTGSAIFTHTWYVTCFRTFNMQTLHSRVYIQTIARTPPHPCRANVTPLYIHCAGLFVFISAYCFLQTNTGRIRDPTLTSVTILLSLEPNLSLQKKWKLHQWKPTPCNDLSVPTVVISFARYFMTDCSIFNYDNDSLCAVARHFSCWTFRWFLIHYRTIIIHHIIISSDDHQMSVAGG